MSYLFRRIVVFIFVLAVLLGGAGIATGVLPASSAITSGEPGHRPPFLHVIPGSDGASLTVKAGRLDGFDPRLHSTLRIIGSTSSEPGHTSYDPGKDVYTFIFDDVTTPGATSPMMTALITTTTDGGPVVLGSSDFVRHYVAGDANMEVVSQDSHTRLLMPRSALLPDSYLILMNTVAPPGDIPPGHRLLGQPYAIRASGAVTQSLTPLLLQIDYDPGLLDGASSHTIGMYWWNEGAGRWQMIDSEPFGDQPTFVASIRQMTGAYALMIGTTWSDTFLDYSGVAERQNIRLAYGGRLALRSGFTQGYAISTPISPTTPFSAWGELRYTAEITAGAVLTVDVLAADNSILLANASDGASLATIDPVQHPRLRLAARFGARQPGATPYLDKWALTWTAQTSPAMRLYLPLLLAHEGNIAAGGAEEIARGSLAARPMALSATQTLTLGCDPPPLPPLTWSPPVALTPAHAIAIAADVAVDSNSRIHAVWYEGNAPVFYASKENRDADWSAPVSISGGAGTYPDLTTDEAGTVHVAWEASGDIFYAAKPAGGAWSAPVNLTHSSQTDAQPAIFADVAGNLRLVWGSDSPGNREILYAFKPRGANAWSAPARVSNTADRSWAPDVVADSQGGVHVVWYDFTPGVTEIYYAAKAPGAAAWSEAANVSETAGGSQWPALGIDGSDRLHLVWQDTLTLGGQGQAIILYYASKSAGEGWSPRLEIARSQANGQKAQPPALAVSRNGAIHVAWAAMTDYRLYYAIRPDHEAGWSQAQVVTTLIPPPNPANQWYFIGLAADADRGVHLAWNDMESGATFNQDIKYSAALPPPIPPDHVLVLDEDGRAAAGACIYQDGQLVGTTDELGMFAPAELNIGDHFVALKPLDGQTAAPSGRWAYRTALTSLTLGTDGVVTGHTVAAPGRQRLSLHKHTPLVYFDLIVSIQWNATPEYIQGLAIAFERASNYLFDASDGQMVFGHVDIYDDGVRWDEADIQILTRNNVRPYAYIGGLTSPDPSQVIRVGRHWDGSSGAEGSWAERRGFRTLVHEFGHYGLHLYDSYFEYTYHPPNDPQGVLVGINTATGCTMNYHDFDERTDTTNATLMTSQYTTTELSAQGVAGLWEAKSCKQTAQWQMSHESDWETLLRHYADAADPPRWRFTGPFTRQTVLAGPDALPPSLLSLPVVVTHERGAATPVRRLLVLAANGRPYAEGALVALDTVRDGRQITLDQGITDRNGRIEVYGAIPGNMLRAVAIDGSLSAQTMIGAQAPYTLTLKRTGVLTAASAPLNPYAILVPNSEGKDLTLTVGGIGAGGALSAMLIPPGGGLGQTVILGYSPTSGVYTGSVSFPVAVAGLGSSHVRGVHELGQPIALDADFHLAPVQTDGEQDLYSPDGDAWLHLDGDSFDAENVYFVLMPTGAAPEPLPAGMVVLGNAYNLAASGARAALTRPALLRLFYEPNDLPPNTDPSALRIARWDAGHWQILVSETDADRFAISARIDRLGIYVLLALGREESESQVYLPLWLK